jgi:hypothetical protein
MEKYYMYGNESAIVNKFYFKQIVIMNKIYDIM